MLKRLYLMSVAHIITTASAGSLLTDDGIAERGVDTRKPSVSFRSDLVTDLFFAYDFEWFSNPLVPSGCFHFSSVSHFTHLM